MIPPDWEPCHRRDDGELIGYLVPVGDDLVVPATIFGHRLDDPMPVHAAEQTLEDIGLSYLADVWLLRDDDGADQRVVLLEATPEHVVVANAAFAHVVGQPRDLMERRVLEVPTDRLRRS
jgi:hypothetical protein